ncbi:MAG: hypothetical protein KOO62_12410 [candidate division Zixibacteria bacterium]|nr:hypothetical protein [candidate division Zixibacteria bacterium]
MCRFVLLFLTLLTLCLWLAACGDDDNPVDTDTTPPVISEVTPPDGVSVLDWVSIMVYVSDNEGVTQVEFIIDDSLYFTDTLEPWLYNWICDSVDDSTMHQIQCVAYDAAGNSDSSEVHSMLVRVTDRTPPSILEVMPTDGTSTQDSVIITVDVTDNKGITQVGFYIDDSLHFTDFITPWSYTWICDSVDDSTTHQIQCVAYDAAGNSDTSDVHSVLVRITVIEPPPSLAGYYYGWYSRTDEGGSGVKQEQRILWVFTDQKWILDVDTDNMTDFCICESSGRYVLEDRIRLTVDASDPLGELCVACIESQNPSGLFALDRSTDTLIMSQLLTDNGAGMSILVEVKLLPVDVP